MKTVKIFLASSEELKQERLELADLVEHLNNTLNRQDIHIQLVKWEYLDSSMGATHKQEEYNQALRDCDICMVIYWNRFGMYTQQELDTAYSELCAGRNPHKLYVYFKDTTEASAELTSFRDSFPQKYGHFYCHFENIDTMKADFLLQFMEYQNKEIGKSTIEVRDSQVMIGNESVIHLNNVPFVDNNEEYQQLQKSIERTRKFLRRIEPDDPDYAEAAQELQDMLKKQQQMENSLWDTALMITQLSNQKCSERLERAMQLFKAGDNKGASAILNEDEIEKDVRHNLQLVKLGEEGKKGLEINIEEIKLKIKTLKNEYADGWMDKVEDLRRQILEICQQLYGEESERTAEAYRELSYALDIHAKYDEALTCAEKGLYISQNVLGENHPATAQSFNNVGSEYSELGNHQKALEYKEKALNIYLNVFGKYHPDTAVFYYNVGYEYDELGDYLKALECHEKALKIRLEVLGEQNIDTASSYNNIGLEYRKLGNHQKAVEYLKKTLSIDLCVYGEYHIITFLSYNNIGQEYIALGDYLKAIEYIGKALEFAKKKKSKHLTSTLYNRLAQAYQAAGDIPNAIVHYQQAAERYTEQGDEENANENRIEAEELQIDN